MIIAFIQYSIIGYSVLNILKIFTKMKKIFLLAAFISLTLISNSQEASFTVSVQPDTLLLGNQLEVSFKLENGNSQNFTPPTFEGFMVVAGPNMSSSMMMVNGTVSQSVTYSYALEAKEAGVFFIPPAKIETEEGDLFTEPLEIIVLPNPDGIIQKKPRSTRSLGWDNDFFNMPELRMPSMPNVPTPKGKQKSKKKKRKTYKL